MNLGEFLWKTKFGRGLLYAGIGVAGWEFSKEGLSTDGFFETADYVIRAIADYENFGDALTHAWTTLWGSLGEFFDYGEIRGLSGWVSQLVTYVGLGKSALSLPVLPKQVNKINSLEETVSN